MIVCYGSLIDGAAKRGIRAELSCCREEIAECSERAYSSLSTSDAKKLMMFGSDQEALSYAQEVSAATVTLPRLAVRAESSRSVLCI